MADTLPRRRAAVAPVRRDASNGRPPRVTGARLLVLGWNRRVPALVAELAGYRHERFDVTIASRISADHRRKLIESLGGQTGTTNCLQVDADYGVPGELETLDPIGYDVVLAVASEWLETGEHADARTISAALLLREMAGARRPAVVLELSSADNAELLPKSAGEVVITPRIMSYVLTQIALRPDVGRLIEELFAAGGTEISMVPRETYEIPAKSVSFSELEQIAGRHGHTAIGYLDPDGEIVLNPPRAASVPENAMTLVSLVTNER